MTTFSRTFGTGPRKVIAIHCSLAHSGAWAGVGKLMGNEISLLAMDMPGHGRSSDFDGQGDIQDFTTAEGLALLSEPMDVIGHSFGATVALRMAIARPDLVRTLTLIEPVFFAIALEDAPEVVEAHETELADFENGLKTGDYELAARTFVRVWGDGRKWTDLPDELRQYMIDRITFIPLARPALYDDRAGLLSAGVLDAVSMPTLVVDGGATHPIMTPVCDGLANRLPNATRLTVDGAGHMVPITHAGAFADGLRGLFSLSPAQ